MKKIITPLYYIGLVFSLIIGIWHFFVPTTYQWFSYISSEYENLKVGIIWINYFFSLMLSGLSIISIFWGKKVFEKNKEAFFIFGFLVFIWLNRVAIAFIIPWPLEPVAWTAYAQLIGTILIFVFLLVPFLVLLKKKK